MWCILSLPENLNYDKYYTPIPLSFLSLCTAKTQYQKLEIYISRKGIARPQSQFPHHVSVIGPHIFLQQKADRSWEYINRSQTRECGNWDWDECRAIPFLGTHKSDFRRSEGSIVLGKNAAYQNPQKSSLTVEKMAGNVSGRRSPSRRGRGRPRGGGWL
jgi:hypothetical protein